MNKWSSISTFVSSITKGITPKYVDKSSIAVLNQKCIRNNRIDYSLIQYTDDNKRIREDKFIQVGDILVNSTGTGTAGRCAFVSSLPSQYRLIVDSHILILRCPSFHTAQCLSYVLYSFEKELMSYMTGSSGQSELDRVVLLNIQTRMPTDPQLHKSIASILHLLDRKIDINRQLISELENIIKLIYDYWFIQFDFPNSKGKPYKTSGGAMTFHEGLKKEVPSNWKVKPLSKVTSNVSRGISPKYVDKGGVCVLNQKCIRNGRVHFAFSKRHANKKDVSHRALELYDVLVNSTGVGTLGRVAVINRLRESTILADSHVTVARANPNEIDVNYFGANIVRRQKEIENFGLGSTGQVELSRDQLDNILIPLPPPNLQEDFSSIYKPAQQKIAVCEAEIEFVTELRDWLLPILMNGQVKVAEVEEDLAMAAEEGVEYKTKRKQKA